MGREEAVESSATPSSTSGWVLCRHTSHTTTISCARSGRAAAEHTTKAPHHSVPSSLRDGGLLCLLLPLPGLDPRPLLLLQELRLRRGTTTLSAADGGDRKKPPAHRACFARTTSRDQSVALFLLISASIARWRLRAQERSCITCSGTSRGTSESLGGTITAARGRCQRDALALGR